MSQSVQLHYEGKVYEYPIIEGTEKEKAIDISKLRDQTGLITLDLGFKNTGSTTSAITFLDGELGILRYRGYDIADLADKSGFMEVSYLLIHGELPTKQALLDFEAAVKKHTFVPEPVLKMIALFPPTAHPMAILSAAMSAMAGFYPKTWDPDANPEAIEATIYQLLGAMSVISAAIYKNTRLEPFNYPFAKAGYCTNFLKMMHSTPTQEAEIDSVVADALNKLLILHADHEQNCSTSTVRTVGSSYASLYASISAGVGALWGKSHGGANQAVIEMLEDIKATGGNVEEFIDDVKNKKGGMRLMGFGHRVYKNFDPRAKIIKTAADRVLSKLGVQDPLLEIAMKLEETALKDPYFINKKLYPNVDFYSGIIYRALGIPTEMFTVMFALGRLPGWIAQWKEMIGQKQPIVRPRQIYTGQTLRSYTANR
jgi:citrate synthase